MKSLSFKFLSGSMLLAISLGMSGLASAQTTSVTTDPVGYFTIQCQAASDTQVAIPFTRPPAFVGAVQSVSGSVVTVSGTPGWTANQFVYAAGTQSNHYYALLGAGTTAANPKEGRIYDVTANSTNSLTLNPNGDDLSVVPAGAQITVIPYWTLATVFPAANAYPATGASFTPTTSTRAFQTQIFVPDYANQGVNPSYSATYFFSNNVNGTTNNVGWRLFGDNTTDHGDDILVPDGYFVVRTAASASTLPLVLVGGVVTKKLTVPLATLGNGQKQDNVVSITRPVDIALKDSGLNPSDGSFVATTSTRNFGDQLFMYDPSEVGFNKAPAKTYFYSNNVNGTTNNVGWRLFGDNTTDHGNDVIPAGSPIIIRKAGTASGQTAFWTNSPTY